MAWKPDHEQTLKTLIRETILAVGPIDAATLPHHIKERLKDQVKGEVDLDKLIAEAIKEAKQR